MQADAAFTSGSSFANPTHISRTKKTVKKRGRIVRNSLREDHRFQCRGNERESTQLLNRLYESFAVRGDAHSIASEEETSRIEPAQLAESPGEPWLLRRRMRSRTSTSIHTRFSEPHAPPRVASPASARSTSRARGLTPNRIARADVVTSAWVRAYRSTRSWRVLRTLGNQRANQPRSPAPRSFLRLHSGRRSDAVDYTGESPLGTQQLTRRRLHAVVDPSHDLLRSERPKFSQQVSDPLRAVFLPARRRALEFRLDGGNRHPGRETSRNPGRSEQLFHEVEIEC